jgi:hypothetical protein
MTTVSNPLDEQYLIGAQDVDEPTWTPDVDIAAMQNVEDPNDQFDQVQPTSIRTASGGIDFLNGLSENVEGLMQSLIETPRAPERNRPKLDVIRTKKVASDKWRGRTAVVTEFTGGQPIVVRSDKRRRILIYNQGVDPAAGTMAAYLSSISNVKPGASNTFRLLYDAFLYNPLELFTMDDVYAVCAPTETTTLAIIEEFDMES